MNKKINTIYIISKGRPHCVTAATLTNAKYTGEWYIVCGNNDERLPEYVEKWGEGRVIVFDWYEEIKHCDFLDNFGCEKKSSGAVPVRNAVRRISEQRGEIRHWQFDDDYTAFYHIDKDLKKWKRLEGEKFEKSLYQIADFADTAQLQNVGFAVATDTRPEVCLTVGKRVFNAHNMPSDSIKFTKWRGRLNDDVINALDVYKYGGCEFSFKYMSIIMEETQSKPGGNTEIYLEDGTVRKTAYSILIDPKNTELVLAKGRYRHKILWRNVSPKLLHEKYAKI